MQTAQNSPAKLNLFLEILNRRGDGYHELQTVMLRTKWHDRLEFQRRDDGQIKLQLHDASHTQAASGFPLDESNLIIKAARKLQQITGTRYGAEIVVTKVIPAEAGLAGGSSNAATTLQSLNSLWECGAADRVLHEIAAKLGSDINFFLPDCTAAECTGRGENVRPIVMANKLFAVAVRHTIGNPTGAVFEATKISQSPATAEKLIAALADQDSCHSENVAQLSFNRLTSAAQKLNPGMHSMMRVMEDACGRRALMSGSGSTCFLLFDSVDEATDANLRLNASADSEWLSLGVLELDYDDKSAAPAE